MARECERVVSCYRKVIQPHHLSHLVQCDTSVDSSQYNRDTYETKIMPLEDAIKNVEKNIIVTAHNRLKSSYKVAEALEISRSKAYRLIRKYCGDAFN